VMTSCSTEQTKLAVTSEVKIKYQNTWSKKSLEMVKHKQFKPLMPTEKNAYFVQIFW